MKSMNLLALVNAKNKLSSAVFDQYIQYFGIHVKENELQCIESMIHIIIENEAENLYLLEGYFIGFTINQISKEFDLLRIGANTIVNIELKQENTGEERLKKQLLQNRYYLNFLGKTVHSFTYVADEQKLFHLNLENESLTEIPATQLIRILDTQKLAEVENIQALFDPSKYLVSPFNSPEAFMSGQYFLTSHQDNIKSKILNLPSVVGPTFISIEGAAGTGKSLLTYDVAKEYRNQKRNVLLFHVGNLNSGHRKLNSRYSWNIVPIKDYKTIDLNKYDVIIFDEVQRIQKHQLFNIINTVRTSNTTVIFSYDGDQCLAWWEIEWNIPQYIQKKLTPHSHYKLTEKIRTNKEIASFIKNLFDLSKVNPTQTYSNIHLQFFATSAAAREYVRILDQQGWEFINYTPSRFDKLPSDRYYDPAYGNAHKVIGQEYDQVVAIVDSTFYYDEEGKLSTRGFYEYYSTTKMLFQILTRARKKLTLIIIGNENVLQACLKILN